MPLFKAAAVSALILGVNIVAFAPRQFSIRNGPIAKTRVQSQSSLRMAIHSPPEIDFYKVLGVNKNSEENEIKTAYRKLAKLYHPDVNPNNDTTEQFQALNRAYEVLSNPGLKKNYDMFGDRGIGTSAASDKDVGEHINRRGGRHPDEPDFWGADEFFGGFGRTPPDFHGPIDFDTFARDGGGGGGGWGGPPPEADFATRWGATMGKDASNRQRRAPHVPEENMDFDWFGGGGRKDDSRHRPYGPIIGDDIAIDFEVDFKVAALGGPVEIKLNRIEECDTCDGSGATENTKKATCTTCGGSGISIPVGSRSGPVFSIACPNCHGTGETLQNPCSSCNGAAVKQRTATVKVEIPAGISDGNKVRIQGEGDTGPNAGPAGDLFLFIKIRDDPLFRKEGSDIHSDATINCVDAIRGTTVQVPVVDGEASVEIPPGTQPGHVICVKRRGAASLSADQRGDHFVHIDVLIPNGEEDTENELVKLLTKDLVNDSPNPFSVSFPSTSHQTTEGMNEKKAEVVNASVSFPPSSYHSNTTPDAAGVASGASSTMIDSETLSELKDQAALAEDEKKERQRYEELAAQREKDLQEQARKLQELEVAAIKEREERLRYEELAAQREMALEESIRRQEEMNREITIRIQQTNGQTSRITLKKSTKMSKIFEMVARQKGFRLSDIQFSFQGRALEGDDTPLDLSMDTNSMIEMSMKRARTAGGVGVGVRF